MVRRDLAERCPNRVFSEDDVFGELPLNLNAPHRSPVSVSSKYYPIMHPSLSGGTAELLFQSPL